MWCGDTPTRMVGATSAVPSRWATSRPRRSACTASTSSGRWRPCCSTAPQGTTTSRRPSLSAVWISPVVIDSSSTCPPPGGPRGPGAGSSLPGRGHPDDGLDLDGDVEWQLGHADGRPGATADVAEDVDEQVRAAVDDGGRAVE